MRERPWESDPELRAQAEAARAEAEAEGTRGGRFTNGHTDPDEAPLLCVQPTADSISSIPPRQWAYGKFLLFGYPAVIGAVDGGGKGAMAIVIALSMITGRPLLGERVWRSGPVAIISYEDDETEWRRRIAAACLHYGIEYEAVIPHFYFIHRPRSRVQLAAQSGRGTITFPDGNAIIAHLKTIGAALLLIDPFNHAHALEDGNNNALIAKVAGEAARIAAESSSVVLVLHHLRKGSTGDADDLMGALSLRATFRSCRILARMTEKEAESLGLSPRQAWRYLRIAGSKENYSPPADRGTWYKLESVDLHNPAGIYLDGDNVQTIVNWEPPSAFKDMPRAIIAEIFAALRTPPGPELRYSPDSRSDEWVGHPIARIAGKTPEEAARVVRAWIENKVLIKEKYTSPKNRKPRRCVTLDEAKAAEILGPLYAPGPAE